MNKLNQDSRQSCLECNWQKGKLKRRRKLQFNTPTQAHTMLQHIMLLLPTSHLYHLNSIHIFAMFGLTHFASTPKIE